MTELATKGEDLLHREFEEDEGELLEICLGAIEVLGGGITPDPEDSDTLCQIAENPADNPNGYKVLAIMDSAKKLEAVVVTGDKLMDDTGVGKFRLEVDLDTRSVRLFQVNTCPGGLVDRSYLLRVRPELLSDLASELETVFDIEGSCV